MLSSQTVNGEERNPVCRGPKGANYKGAGSIGVGFVARYRSSGEDHAIKRIGRQRRVIGSRHEHVAACLEEIGVEHDRNTGFVAYGAAIPKVPDSGNVAAVKVGHQGNWAIKYGDVPRRFQHRGPVGQVSRHSPKTLNNGLLAVGLDP